MPTYDYECKACNHAFSAFQSMKDPVLKTCPKCKKDALKRLIGTGAGFIFKGSGFYCTDYRSDSYKSDAKGDSGVSVASPTDAPKAAKKKGDAKKSSKKEKTAAA